jgi:RimJ/RimL family protein N-acetyltransferase
MFHPHYLTLKDGRAALIRRAEPADAEALIDMVNEVGAEQVYIMTEKFRMTVGEETDFLRRLDARQTLFLVAIVDRQLVASADVERGRLTKNAHTASFGVALRRSVRGLGLGKAMLEDMIRWAKEEGVRKVTLGVFATNESALALYRGLGFAEEARLRGQVILKGQPVDEVLMALWL